MVMKRNMGAVDKLVRLVVALLIIIAYYQEIVTGVFGIILLIVGGIFVLTSLVSVCPLYSIFGIKTCQLKKEKG